MARVGLTKDIKDSISKKVYNLYAEQIKQAIDSKPVIGETVYKLFMEEHGVTRSGLSHIPKQFLHMRKEILFHWTDANGTKRAEKFDFPDERPMGESWDSSYATGLTLKDETLIKLLKEWRARMTAVEVERNKAVSTVKNIMEQCSTANQLLKVAPDLKNLMPQWVLTKLEEKKERAAPTKASVDAEALEQLSNTLAVGILSGAV